MLINLSKANPLPSAYWGTCLVPQKTAIHSRWVGPWQVSVLELTTSSGDKEHLLARRRLHQNCTGTLSSPFFLPNEFVIPVVNIWYNRVREWLERPIKCFCLICVILDAYPLSRKTFMRKTKKKMYFANFLGIFLDWWIFKSSANATAISKPAESKVHVGYWKHL